MTGVRFTLPQVEEYPDGVDGHDRSKRLRGLAALSWALGLSHRMEQDKIQDDQGIQEYGWNDERTGTDPVGMER